MRTFLLTYLGLKRLRSFSFTPQVRCKDVSGREDDHSTTSSSEINNGAVIPPKCLHEIVINYLSTGTNY
jgi:hypothetical protein